MFVNVASGKNSALGTEGYDYGFHAKGKEVLRYGAPVEVGGFDGLDIAVCQDGGFGFVEDQVGYGGVGVVGEFYGGGWVEEDGHVGGLGGGEDLEDGFDGDLELEDEEGGEGGAEGGGAAEGGGF